MRTLFTAAAGTILLAAGAATADEFSDTVRAAVGEAAPSVVRIQTVGSAADSQLPVSSQVTTGIVISDRHEILTSSFGFSSQPAAVFVQDLDGQRVAAQVVAKDHVRKLVLLKCTNGRFTPIHVTPGSDTPWPAVGAWSIALGRLYPSATPAVSVGIVSAVRRIYGIAIQTDAKISPVNYGGPLIGIDGRVMGILVPLSPSDRGEQIRAGVEWYDSGIGFAIPLADAFQSAERLREGRDLKHGIAGIRPSTRNPLETKVTIKEVLPNSPAATAGLQPGDQIVAANGKPVERFGHFDAVMRRSYAHDILQLTVVRNGSKSEVEIQLAEDLKLPPQGFLGLVPVSKPDSKEDTDGLAVHTLDGSPAAEAGLPKTAVITHVNDKPVTSLKEFLKQLGNLYAGETVRLAVRGTDDSNQSKTVSVTAKARPSRLVVPSSDLLTAITGDAAQADWKRTELQLGENGSAWLYAPPETTTAASGIVILLSDSDVPQETVLTLWGDLCRTYNLLLLVPANAEATSLSREDAGLVSRALGRSVTGRTINARRIILVAGEAQKELCTELLLHPRLPQFRAAAFLRTWPDVTSVSPEILQAKAPAVLLLTSDSGSREAKALKDLSVQQLTDGGSWVVEMPWQESDKDRPEKQIAIWSIYLGAR